MTQETTGYEKQLSDIEEHGLHVIHVLADERGPGFSYSVGLFHNYQHPEIIIIGLKKDLAHVLINNIGYDIQQGQIYEDILDNYKCLMIEVDRKHYDEYLGQAIRFYKSKEFPALQCVYPTIKGIYPWEENWPKGIINIQPLIGQTNLE